MNYDLISLLILCSLGMLYLWGQLAEREKASWYTIAGGSFWFLYAAVLTQLIVNWCRIHGVE